MTIEPTNTAMTPELQYELATKLAHDLLVDAQMIHVKDQESLEIATDTWKKASDFRHKLDSIRKAQSEPLRRVIAEINDKCNEIILPLNETVTIIKEKTTEYRLKLEKERIQDLKEKQEAAKIIGIEESVYIPPVAKTLKGDDVIAYTKTEKKFKVVEAYDVPRQFLMVNEEAVKLAIKQGCSNIPGIEIYEETKTVLRSR
jgi:hypothetical protein